MKNSIYKGLANGDKLMQAVCMYGTCPPGPLNFPNILKLSIVELSISRLGFWVLRIGQEMDLRGKMNKDF